MPSNFFIQKKFWFYLNKNITIDKENIKFVSNAKMSDVHFDSKLNFNSHLEKSGRPPMNQPSCAKYLEQSRKFQ